GAVAYLAKAMGIEPAINGNGDFTTGGGNYIANANQSTTENVTGVYDMSGGTWETMSAYLSEQNSGNMDNLIAKKDTKYVDVYAKGANVGDSDSNYQANSDKYGDALYETSSNGGSSPMCWSGNYAYYLSSNGPVFYHGGYYGNVGVAGLFAFSCNTGRSNRTDCWRRGLHFMTCVHFFPSIYSKRVNATRKRLFLLNCVNSKLD
ncbi:MAG: hypothetical protein RR751_07030, partial [Clostridia bacterium]